MRAFPRTITYVLLAVALTTTAYVFRGQLADAPIVTTVADGLGWRAGMAHEPRRVTSASYLALKSTSTRGVNSFLAFGPRRPNDGC